MKGGLREKDSKNGGQLCIDFLAIQRKKAWYDRVDREMVGGKVLGKIGCSAKITNIIIVRSVACMLTPEINAD